MKKFFTLALLAAGVISSLTAIGIVQKAIGTMIASHLNPHKAPISAMGIGGSGNGIKPFRVQEFWALTPGPWATNTQGSGSIASIQNRLLGDTNAPGGMVTRATDFLPEWISADTNAQSGGTLRYCVLIPAPTGEKIYITNFVMAESSSDDPSGGQAGNRLGYTNTASSFSASHFGVQYFADGSYQKIESGSADVGVDVIGFIMDPKLMLASTIADKTWVAGNILQLSGEVWYNGQPKALSYISQRGLTIPSPQLIPKKVGGDLVTSFSVIGNIFPGYFSVQSASQVTGPWTQLGTTFTVANGVVSFKIPIVRTGGTSMFYRLTPVSL